MLSKKNYEIEHVEEVARLYPKVGKAQLTATIFAFGLLEALADSGLPFCFKGGTALLLLLDKPRRVSTDIDIVVPEKTDFDAYFEHVKDRFPFYRAEERGNIANPSFRHFYFYAEGGLNPHGIAINLDVAFEDDPFLETVEREISLPFLIRSGVPSFVTLPTLPCILGDKLTAFAPHTVGVNPHFTSLGKPMDNRLQVMKQMHDIARIFDESPDFNLTKESYLKSLAFENAFRRTSYSARDALLDALHSALCIASFGRVDDKGEYPAIYKPGIQGLSSNVFDGVYRQQEASEDASKVALLCAGLLNDFDIFARSDYPSCSVSELRQFKMVRSKEAFARIKCAYALLGPKHCT